MVCWRIRIRSQLYYQDYSRRNWNCTHDGSIWVNNKCNNNNNNNNEIQWRDVQYHQYHQYHQYRGTDGAGTPGNNSWYRYHYRHGY